MHYTVISQYLLKQIKMNIIHYIRENQIQLTSIYIQGI